MFEFQKLSAGPVTVVQGDPAVTLLESIDTSPLSGGGGAEHILFVTSLQAENTDLVDDATLTVTVEKRNDADAWEAVESSSIVLRGDSALVVRDRAFPVLSGSGAYTGVDFGTLRFRVTASCTGNNVTIAKIQMLLHGSYLPSGI